MQSCDGVLSSILAQPRAIGRGGRQFDLFPTGLTRETAEELAEFVERLRPRYTLETGMG